MSKRKGFSGVNFIQQWARSNGKIRCYQKAGLYPPPLSTPANYYNLWRPFYAQTLKGDYTPNEQMLQNFRHHLFVLCGNSQIVFDYVEKWISQMLQFPALKTIAIVMVSKEGAGKGYFCKVIEQLIGQKKYLELTDFEKVAGNFNSLLKDKCSSISTKQHLHKKKITRKFKSINYRYLFC